MRKPVSSFAHQPSGTRPDVSMIPANSLRSVKPIRRLLLLCSRMNLDAARRAAATVFVCMLVSSVAHAQGSIDMSGATNVMNTFKTFALYAGAVICLGSLIFAGIRLMSGRFQDAIPALFGALFGAGVLGWGAGWISSLTGQSVTQ